MKWSSTQIFLECSDSTRWPVTWKNTQSTRQKKGADKLMLASEVPAGHVMSTDCWVPLSEWLILEAWGENWNPAVLTRSQGMLMRDRRPYWAIMRDWREENRRGRKHGGEMQESNAEWGRGWCVNLSPPWPPERTVNTYTPDPLCKPAVQK